MSTTIAFIHQTVKSRIAAFHRAGFPDVRLVLLIAALLLLSGISTSVIWELALNGFVLVALIHILLHPISHD